MNTQQTEIAQLKDENVELENELKSLVLNFDDARNRLKAAEAEIERLRTALQTVVDCPVSAIGAITAQGIARAALKLD